MRPALLAALLLVAACSRPDAGPLPAKAPTLPLLPLAQLLVAPEPVLAPTSAAVLAKQGEALKKRAAQR